MPYIYYVPIHRSLPMFVNTFLLRLPFFDRVMRHAIHGVLQHVLQGHCTSTELF